ncbi:MAG: hypothetical protein ACK56I_09910, partial [bacterium]
SVAIYPFGAIGEQSAVSESQRPGMYPNTRNVSAHIKTKDATCEMNGAFPSSLTHVMNGKMLPNFVVLRDKAVNRKALLNSHGVKTQKKAHKSCQSSQRRKFFA